MSAPTSHPHQKLITSLMEMVGFLTDHPELPLGPNDTAMLCFTHPQWPHASDSDQVAFVRQVARVLDVDPQWEGETRFFAALAWERAGIEAVATFAACTDEAVQSARIYPVTAATVQVPAADVDQAVPEADCEPCDGTGTYDGGCCAFCLGKGRVSTWVPSPQFTAAYWGGAAL